MKATYELYVREAAKRAAAPLRRSGEPWVQIVPIRGR
jgi:hypothetical protein